MAAVQTVSCRHFAERALAGHPSALIGLGEDDRLCYLNPAAEELLGYRQQEVTGRPLDLLLPIEPATLLQMGNPAEGQHPPLICRAQTKDGLPLLVSVSLWQWSEARGRSVTLQVERNVEKDNSPELEAVLTQALDQLGDMVWITDHEGVIRYVNPAFEEGTGFSSREVVGRNTSTVLKSGRHDAAFYRRLWDTLDQGAPFRDVFVNRTRDGSLVHMDETITPVRDSQGRVRYFVATARDITNRLSLENRLQELASSDPLTGLANREHILQQTQTALQWNRQTGFCSGLLLLDLHQFKRINESHGHSLGDAVLQTVAQRLQTAVRRADTVARIGADHFLVLVENLDDCNQMGTLATTILEAVNGPLTVEDQPMVLRGRMGVSLIRPEDTDAGTMLKRAEAALGRAKSESAAKPVFHDPAMDQQVHHFLRLEAELHQALEREEFQLFYQPKVATDSGRIQGVEALIRWIHPERGTVSPAEFIPILEDTGLVDAVGEWALETGCRQARAWHDAGHSELVMNVNVSPRQFRGGQFEQVVARALEKTGFPAAYLEIEITESLLVDDLPGVARSLERLREMGVGIALDDFGTGYSALNYLLQFPIGTLKIDRSITQTVTQTPRHRALVEGLLRLAEGQELITVVEGVETCDQLEALRDMNCHQVQGFAFGRPEPAEALTNRLRESERLEPRPA